MAGDLADGESALGPPWLALIPKFRFWMSKWGLLPEDVRLLWAVYAPLVEKVVEGKRVDAAK
jgi:hypothetical protein